MLMEECAEVQKECSKILRFGCSGEKLKSLASEMVDLEVMLGLAKHSRCIENSTTEVIEESYQKKLKYIKVSQELGKIGEASNIN